ncbi:hypothetical protein GCM10009716_27430 [Streptomyces sodiiphilus]|uniref:Pyridoxamine 5'-phosphate oxidase family protein n=1 Tax=Streptomyces sodiiphilus TaxID=226217 RepID=A0ABN2PBI9_9ACTN
MNPSDAPRLVEVTGAEALWLLESAARGRLVYVERGAVCVRPAVHVLERGWLVVRAPARAAALSDGAVLAYHTDEAGQGDGTGWTVTAAGPADFVTDPHEAAHYRRTLCGWTHGPHDTLLRMSPRVVTGFRVPRL